MFIIIVIICNIAIFLINLIFLFFLVKLRKYLFEFNNDLIDLEKKIIIYLKQIPLNILLTALEIQEYKHKYQAVQIQIKKLSKIIIISRYIYKLYQKKFI